MDGRSPRRFFFWEPLASASSGWPRVDSCRFGFLMDAPCPDTWRVAVGIDTGLISIGISLCLRVTVSAGSGVVSRGPASAVRIRSIRVGVAGTDNESTGITTSMLSAPLFSTIGPSGIDVGSVSLCSRNGVTINTISAKSASQYCFNSFCSTWRARKRLDEDDFSPICSRAPISLCESPSSTDRRNTFPYCSGRRSISAIKSS